MLKKNVFYIIITLLALLLMAAIIIAFDKKIEQIELQQRR